MEERDAIENHNTSKVVEGTDDESKNKDSPSMRFQLSLFQNLIQPSHEEIFGLESVLLHKYDVLFIEGIPRVFL